MGPGPDQSLGPGLLRACAHVRIYGSYCAYIICAFHFKVFDDEESITMAAFCFVIVSTYEDVIAIYNISGTLIIG